MTRSTRALNYSGTTGSFGEAIQSVRLEFFNADFCAASSYMISITQFLVWAIRKTKLHDLIDVANSKC
jgi:hypothetical protein